MTVEQEIAAWRAARVAGVPFAFRGVGRSMWPALRPGDEALFDPLSGPSAVGDVLLYRAGAELVAHRLIGWWPDGRLRLRGDACAADDPPVEPADVLGRLGALRRGGQIWPASHPTLRAFARVLPALAGAPAVGRSLGTLARIAGRLTRLGPRG